MKVGKKAKHTGRRKKGSKRRRKQSAWFKNKQRKK